MFDFFAKIFGYILNFIYGLIGNFGITIIIFTILLRLILLPMTIKQQKTMKKTKKIQGKMREIQEKYSNDPERMNREILNLYQEEKMSPFSGCLSSILQIIVVIAVFFVISRPLTFMKQLPEKTINNYKEQISEKIENNQNYVEISIIKYLADTEKDVDINMDFFGLDLSDVPSQNYSDIKVFIIPALYIITSIISTKMTMAATNTKKKEELVEVTKEDEKLVKVKNDNDEAEMVENMNKSMTYMMPFMTVMIALIAPLGLALYWFVSNLIMLLERLLMKKLIKEEE